MRAIVCADKNWGIGYKNRLLVDVYKRQEEVRLKYRYLDLRRADLQRNLMMKSQVMTLTRQFFSEEGFLEVETPAVSYTHLDVYKRQV